MTRPLGLLVLALTIVAVQPAPAAACAGDCDGGGDVTVDEVITLVSIALGDVPASRCRAGDGSDDGSITVDEIVAAIRSALDGCVSACGVDGALAAFEAGNLRRADEILACAVATAPTDDRALALRAASGVAVTAIESGPLRALAARAGILVTGDSRTLCDLEITLPEKIPGNAPGGDEIVDTVRQVALGELRNAATQLSRVRSATVLRLEPDRLPECLRSATSEVEIDRADLLALRGGVEFVIGILESVGAYDLNVEPGRLEGESARSVLTRDPSLGTLRAASRLSAAGNAFEASFALLGDAVAAILDEQDDQADDLLVVEPDEREIAADLAGALGRLSAAFDGRSRIPVDVVRGVFVGPGEGELLDLSDAFSGSWPSLRDFLPPFNDEGWFDGFGLPDPTFGGAAPGMSQEKIDNFGEGLPACTACASDLDCGAFGFGNTSCFPCAFDCTGTTRRCAPRDGFARCADGSF